MILDIDPIKEGAQALSTIAQNNVALGAVILVLLIFVISGVLYFKFQIKRDARREEKEDERSEKISDKLGQMASGMSAVDAKSIVHEGRIDRNEKDIGGLQQAVKEMVQGIPQLSGNQEIHESRITRNEEEIRGLKDQIK